MYGTREMLRAELIRASSVRMRAIMSCIIFIEPPAPARELTVGRADARTVARNAALAEGEAGPPIESRAARARVERERPRVSGLSSMVDAGVCRSSRTSRLLLRECSRIPATLCEKPGLAEVAEPGVAIDWRDEGRSAVYEVGLSFLLDTEAELDEDDGIKSASVISSVGFLSECVSARDGTRLR